ncbi:MAG: toll/interleukin-1 receptor domain-containing protein [Bacteroidota bacterium]|nr:toll/interleukin-1 receptor domain-containing protein [Bacteroidota bacterium]
MNEKVFITYSWDSEEHKDWVRLLAETLIKNGIEVLLDQFDITPGESFTHFMESSISKANKVLVILTPNYKDKSLERKGGVGYEQQIISGELMSGIDRKKFIPILRLGKFEEGADCAVPPHFKGISTLDFRVSANEQIAIEQLLRAIYNEPKFIKPSLGKKPTFDQKRFNSNFEINLDQNLTFLQSETYLTDIFLQISDLRKSNSMFKLDFNIENISEKYAEYLQLVEINSPSDNEIEKKLQLREDLNNIFFYPNATLYQYLSYAIYSIIDYEYNKYKYITNYKELFVSITNCIKLFSNGKNKTNRETKFDIFHDKIKWNYSIWISDNEVDRLLSVFSVKDKIFLTAVAGLDTFDFSQNTIIEKVIPKLSFQFTKDYFDKRIKEDLRDECFKIGNWKIGLG